MASVSSVVDKLLPTICDAEARSRRRPVRAGSCDDPLAISRAISTARSCRRTARTTRSQQLKSGQFDLVLVNRKLDADYSDGIEIIRQIKADPTIAARAGDAGHELSGAPRRRRSRPAQSAASASWSIDKAGNAREAWPPSSSRLKCRPAATTFASCYFLHGFLHRLHEVRRLLPEAVSSLARLVGFLLLAVLVQRDPLERLIEDAPEGLEANFLGTFGPALALCRLFLRRRPLSSGRLCAFRSAASYFGPLFLATNNFRGHVRNRG